MAKEAKTRTRPGHKKALAKVADAENLNDIEVKRINIVIRASGDVVYKAFEADERVSVGGYILMPDS